MHKISLLIAAIFTASAVSAQPDGQLLSLEQAIAMALDHNPAMLAADNSVAAARHNRQAAAAQLSEAEAAVREVELYLSDAMVYSPVDGEVTTVVAEVGELIGEGYPAVALIDMADQWVEFNVREDLLPAFSIGQQFEGYVPALGRSILLEVSYIAVQADFATWSATRARGGFDVRTFVVKARTTDGNNGLHPGMSVLVDYSLLR